MPDSSPTSAMSVEDDDDEDDDDDDSLEDNAPTVVLPMQLVSLTDAGRTDVGRQRDHNEDCFGVQTEIRKLETPQGSTVQARGLFILCDGMGGHAGGEVASSLAVNTLREYFQKYWFDIDLKDAKLPTEGEIRDSIILANKAIFDINQESARSGSGRMGTTLVMVLVHNTKIAVAHVGDSRLYRVSRRSGLEQVTSDHDVGQREIQRGVEPAIAYARPDALQLTQALGPRDQDFIDPDIEFLDLQEDTLLMLCSDGLADNDLLETHWRTHMEPLLSSQANLDRGVGQLIELANQYNGHDNITALAVRLKMRPNMDMLKRR
jgi:protein phosphatase